MKKHGRSIVAVFVATAVPLLSGCGTLLNITSGRGNPAYDHSKPEIYGGVCEDVRWAWYLVSDSPGGKFAVAGKVAQLVVAPCVMCIDLPLSAVADTLTLPLTVRSTLHATGLNPPSTLEQQKAGLAEAASAQEESLSEVK